MAFLDLFSESRPSGFAKVLCQLEFLFFSVSFDFRRIFFCSTFELFSIVSAKFRKKMRKVFQKDLQGLKIDTISCLRCCTYIDIDVGQTSTFLRQLNYQKFQLWYQGHTPKLWKVVEGGVKWTPLNNSSTSKAIVLYNSKFLSRFLKKALWLDSSMHTVLVFQRANSSIQ